MININSQKIAVLNLTHTLDFTTACRIGTSLVHSKLDYCNSLYLNLPACQLDRLQSIQNCLARTISRTSKFSHVRHTLQNLSHRGAPDPPLAHWTRHPRRVRRGLPLKWGSGGLSPGKFLKSGMLVRAF